MAIENLPFILQGFVTGVVSFFSPCSLSILPAFIAFITSSAKNRTESFILSLFYTIGFALTYAIVYVLIVVGLANLDLRFTFFNIIGGFILIILSIYLFFLKEIQQFFRNIRKKNHQNLNYSTENSNQDQNNIIQADLVQNGHISQDFDEDENATFLEKDEISKRTFYGNIFSAFTLGFSSGGASNACAGAMLATLLTTISALSPTTQLYTMVFYGLGLMLPILAIGILVGEINNQILAKMIILSGRISKVFALLLLWFGIEMVLTGYGKPGILSFI